MLVYLANGDGFNGNMFLLEQIIAHLTTLGHIVCNPWTAHNWSAEVKAATSFPMVAEQHAACRRVATRIAHENWLDIERADTVLAVLNGMEPDSGTVSELAYAAGRGKTVYGIRTDFRDCGDLPGVALNLQVLFFIENSGGCLYRAVEEITLTPAGSPSDPPKGGNTMEELIIGLHTQSAISSWSLDEIEYNVAKASLGHEHYQFTEHPSDEDGMRMIAILRTMGATERQITDVCIHLNFDEPITFDDSANTMKWVQVAIHRECFVDRWGRILNGRYIHRYAEGETNQSYQEFGDLVDASETYHNVYGELCVRKTDKLIPYGIYDAETERAFYWGAYTEIELRPYVHPMFEDEGEYNNW